MLGNKIRGWIRLFFFTLDTFIAFFLITLIGIVPGARYKLRQKVRRIWARLAIYILNFKVEIRGKFPFDRNYLFVGNHRSSLDAFICLAFLQADPVSRHDVRNYLFLGKGAELAGIIFVNKESRTSRNATKDAIYQALKEGKSILIFPEGKTEAKPLTDTFLKGSFDVAAELNIPVIPFALEYKSIDDYWDHTDSLAVHYFKNLAKPKTFVRLSVGEAIYGDSSWALLRQSQEWINGEIIKLREDWGGLAPEK